MYWRMRITTLRVAAASYAIVGLFGATYGVLWLAWPQLPTAAKTVIAAAVTAPVALALVWPYLATVKAFGVEVSIVHATKDPLAADVVEFFMAEATLGLEASAVELDERSLDITAMPRPIKGLNELRAATADQFLTVDLGAGRQWYSTRLYLLAAIADDFLRVPRFVFIGHLPQHGFIGMAQPAELKTALGLALPPEVDAAYVRARRDAAGLPLDDRLPDVGDRFAELVIPIERPRGPDSELSVPWVTGELLYAWMTAAGKNFDTRSLMTTGLSDQQLLLAATLETEDRYIALITATRQLQGVMDRLDVLGQVAAARARSAHLPG